MTGSDAARLGCGLLILIGVIGAAIQGLIDYASSTPARFGLVVGICVLAAVGGVGWLLHRRRTWAAMTPAQRTAQRERDAEAQRPLTVYPECPSCGGDVWIPTGALRDRYRRIGGPGRSTVHGYDLPQGHLVVQRHACTGCGFRGDLVGVGLERRQGTKVSVLDIY